MDVISVRRMAQPHVKDRIKAIALREVDAQTVVVRCADCKWYWRGTVGQGKAAFLSHRELKHS